MTDNLYAPPEAELNKPVEKGTPYVPGFDKKMIIATALLILLSVASSALILMDDLESANVNAEIITLIMTIFLTVFCVFLVKRVRVFGLGSDAENAAEALGVWGYFWRVLLVQIIGAILVVLPVMIVLLLNGSGSMDFLESTVGAVVFSIVLFPVSMICIWMLFSKDRSGQIRRFISIFRGY